MILSIVKTAKPWNFFVFILHPRYDGLSMIAGQRRLRLPEVIPKAEVRPGPCFRSP